MSSSSSSAAASAASAAAAHVKIVVNRDSVCAVDDCMGHEKTISVSPSIKPEALVRLASAADGHGYEWFANVSGSGHWWDVLLNGLHIVTIKGNFESVKTEPNAVVELNQDGSNTLYFKYHSH